jgi:hypothetical protein
MTDSIIMPDKNYQSIIEEKFQHKRKLASAKEKALFHIFDEGLTKDEEFALKFLYAYMPLYDLADYDGSLFLNHVRETFRILRLVPWGNKIPPCIFIHFVLPYRANNENVENYRGIFFEELFDRVKDLSMVDAILEVNHWCHEKATYIACDPRTSSPLSVIRRAHGRCGEESALAVSALRSLCIPARQCYTPRWAHCDSNHAWVEAWADGKWYFFGACEPDPRLNNGWFRDPARRAMLVNTRVPGNYSGPEEITLAHEWYTELNLLSNYAPVKRVTVKVEDISGNPVHGAMVYFQVFNSGEFSRIACLISDEQGRVSLTTGLGDVMVHAAKDRQWGFEKLSAYCDHITVTISDTPPLNDTWDIDMIPPVQTYDEAESYSEEEIRINNERLKEEDRIRTEYEATFINRDTAWKIADELSLPGDRVWNVLEKARGNSHEIAAFLKEETPVYGKWALKLLETLADKDLTDTFSPVLRDHLHFAAEFKGIPDEKTYMKYILRPRVLHEMIGPYRSFFRKEFSEEEQTSFRKCPKKLENWIKTNIEIVEDYVHFQGAATPKGTYKLKKADRISRDIAFVAMARSFGIPSRLHPADKRPQFMLDGSWHDADLETVSETFYPVNQSADGIWIETRIDVHHDNPDVSVNKYASAASQGRIRLIKCDGYDGKIEYFKNFSLARFEKNIFKSMDFKGYEFRQFEDSIEVLPGIYRLITSTRTSSGTSLLHLTVFQVNPGEITEVAVSFREEHSIVPVLGEITDSIELNITNGEKLDIIGSNAGKGLIIAWIEPDKEPSKHLIRELCELSGEYNTWDGKIILCVNSDKVTSAFNENAYDSLPESTSFCIDEKNKALDMIISHINEKPKYDNPMVFVIDAERKLRYVSSGYKPGIGADVLNTLKGCEYSLVQMG